MYVFDSSKTYLVLADNLSALLAACIDSILVSGGNIVIVTSKQETQQEIASKVGINPFLIPVPGHADDEAFFNNNMPGSLEDLEFKRFPLWKGLSIDRLRFWQVNNGLLNEFISKINFDVTILDLDLMSPLTSLSTKLLKNVGSKIRKNNRNIKAATTTTPTIPKIAPINPNTTFTTNIAIITLLHIQICSIRTDSLTSLFVLISQRISGT